MAGAACQRRPLQPIVLRRYVTGEPLALLIRVRIVVSYEIQDNVVLEE